MAFSLCPCPMPHAHQPYTHEHEPILWCAGPGFVTSPHSSTFPKRLLQALVVLQLSWSSSCRRHSSWLRRSTSGQQSWRCNCRWGLPGAQLNHPVLLRVQGLSICSICGASNKPTAQPQECTLTKQSVQEQPQRCHLNWHYSGPHWQLPHLWLALLTQLPWAACMRVLESCNRGCSRSYPGRDASHLHHHHRPGSRSRCLGLLLGASWGHCHMLGPCSLVPGQPAVHHHILLTGQGC